MAPNTRQIIFAFCIFLLVTSPVHAAEDGVDLFVSGTNGYHTYRIPSLIATSKGTLLAFCEGRKTGRADDGDIDLLLRRSADAGKSWESRQVVYEEGGEKKVTIGNPCPVIDQETGAIWLPFCRNNSAVLITSSTDEGQTWSPPRDITPEVKLPGWTWYATGPGVGIQIQRGRHKGRLVIPCDHREPIDDKQATHSHVFFSDDHGESWKLGGTVALHTNECQVVELADGQLLINMRNYWGNDGRHPDRQGMRANARSRDGGETWSALGFDKALIEPVCQASLLAVPERGHPDRARLIFSNPASREARRNLTVRESFDEGKTWPVSREIYAGSAAYSCLAPLPDGRIAVLYEREDYRKVTLAVVPLSPLSAAAP